MITLEVYDSKTSEVFASFKNISLKFSGTCFSKHSPKLAKTSTSSHYKESDFLNSHVWLNLYSHTRQSKTFRNS